MKAKREVAKRRSGATRPAVAAQHGRVGVQAPHSDVVTAERQSSPRRRAREARTPKSGPQTSPIARPVERPARAKSTSQAKARAKARKAKAPKVVRPRLTERLAIRLASIDLRPHTLLSKVPFVVLVIGALGVGLALTLWLSTDSAERSYQLSHARERTRVLQQQKEALERDVREAQSAPALAESARKQGMIPTRDTAHLVQDPSGNWVVVGTPKPADGVPPPPLNGPIPEPGPPPPPPAAGAAAGGPGPAAAGRRCSASRRPRPGPRRCCALRTAPRRSAASTCRRLLHACPGRPRLGRPPGLAPVPGLPAPGVTAPAAGPAEVPSSVGWIARAGRRSARAAQPPAPLRCMLRRPCRQRRRRRPVTASSSARSRVPARVQRGERRAESQADGPVSKASRSLRRPSRARPRLSRRGTRPPTGAPGNWWKWAPAARRSCSGIGPATRSSWC